MRFPSRRIRNALTALWLAALPVLDCAADVGQVKVAKGQVAVERAGRTLAAQVGMPLELADILKTGTDGSVGVTMRDNSLLSAGPNSVLSLERFEFDPATNEGRFESRLQRGTLAVVSGRIAKSAPSAMTVRTPSAVLGVRGTEFLVRVND
ncbi:MAG TPA: FecR domain-containing protein [Rubrivivax sp.]